MAQNRYLTVIIGAGASYDCAGIRITGDNLDYRPPLVNDLFDFRERSFNPILAKYKRAQSLSANIRSRVQRGQHLETILADFAYSSNPVIYRQYLEIPLYLQDLFLAINTYYRISGPTMYHDLVGSIEASNYTRVLYLTTNYDLFLESALEETYPNVTFDSLSQYCRDDYKWDLVKLHGSVNWCQQILNSGGQSGHPLHFLDQVDGKIDLHGEIRVLKRSQDKVTLPGMVWYPTLAVPLAEKTAFCCHESHLQRAIAHLASCTDFLIIGFSALDDPVLQLLKHSRSVRKLEIVNGKQDDGRSALEKIAAVEPRFNSASSSTFLSQNSKITGFTRYMTSREIDEFLTKN